MVQGENVNWWREPSYVSLVLLVLVILAVSSQSDLSVLQGVQICFPFTDDMFASLLCHPYMEITPQGFFSLSGSEL